ncbi:MAG TPA: molybdopterin cofactor-binding domain-containing protein, partial [Candidatus Binataceae bacterium]|nr:molybdopterin cofactor-binding domain-containing protein [Candidatus Binataceae bacterium]
ARLIVESRLPRSIQENPRLENWVDFSESGIARVFTAKVELGQGIVTAMAQIAAEELRLVLSRISVVSGDTRYSPDEGYTAGSMSIEIGGTSLRMACAEAREAMIEEGARILNVEVSRVSVLDGVILIDGARSDLDYWKLAPRLDFRREITGHAALSDPVTARYLGKSVARLDLYRKVTGAAFIQDLEFPGMLHARVMRPPSIGAHLESLDSSAAADLPGCVRIFRSGDFVGVCCEREYQAVKALEALRAGAKWIEVEGAAISHNWAESLPRLRSIDSQIEQGALAGDYPGSIRVSATYSKPPIAHAAMGPSCAIALWEAGTLWVWTHSQGVFPLRGALSAALGIVRSDVIVIHAPGAGCYGHNGADDAALDAALLAREAPGRPVRVQWMRDDELGWAPVGSPMAVKISAAVDADGKIADWRTEIWSAPHGRRPSGRAANLLGAAHMEPEIPFPELHEDLRFFAGGARNSEPAYDIAHRKVTLHSLPELPMRTSALRTLGGYANVFAAESFIDELAQAVRMDPLDFRLRHLSDPRARRVLEEVAALASWRRDAERGTGNAAGIGFCRYKNTAAYVAVIAQVETAHEVRVRKVFCAVDAGLAINPGGVISQIEGGIIQSISWTLKEEVILDRSRIVTNSWRNYPILRFDEVPEVEVRLIEAMRFPPLGVGEAAQGPAAAAVANAVARALDLRIRDLPITRERIIAASIDPPSPP